MKILNLYAGIGGNRKLWGDQHEITAVELNREIAEFCVENVIPYYDLIIPEVPVQQYNRHLFWMNFKIRTTDKRNPPKQIKNIIAQKTKRKRKTYDGHIVNIKSSQPHFGFDLSGVRMASRKDAILRNCVDPELGLMILNCAEGVIKSKASQPYLFNE